MESNLQNIISEFKDIFKNSNELIIKEISAKSGNYAIVYLVGLCDTKTLSEDVIDPILVYEKKVAKISEISKEIISLPESEEIESIKDATSEILKGKAILIFEKSSTFLSLAVDQAKERTLAEPPTSTVLKGPRAGFIENIKTNVSVLRKILATPDLRTINMSVGKRTNTAITIMYIDGIADPGVVKQVEEKIKGIDIDGIIDSFYVAQFLENHKNSMFKQIGNSEKPDIVSAKLLEGRVAILVDGSPIVLTVPFIYMEDLQSGDDYYSNHSRATFVRWVRIMSIFITILAPSIYIAVVLHHYKAIPLKFLITIINSTKGLPLTPFAEILFVLILFEILYEASLRMPKYLGLALSIVGALILGDTAVKAGLISPPAVMLVAISGLTIYCVPDQAPQLFILRFVFTFAGAMLGFFGITAMLIFLVMYLCDFDSYGTAYLSPIAPFIDSDMNDTLYKTDIVNIKYRPRSINNNKKNLKRQGKKNGKKTIR